MRVTALALQLSLAGRLAYSSSTCPFRTANYITHGLPQQCLAGAGPPEATPFVNGTEGLGQQPIPIATTVDAKNSGHGSSTVGTSGQASREPTGGSSIDDANSDSVLEDAKFLTFEDWKKKNLAEVGQSHEVLAERTAREPRRRPGGMNNEIDSIGEDPEIDLNFGGFDTPQTNHKPNVPDDSRPPSGDRPEPKGQARSRMAGKTSKERTNYASFDCGAIVRKTHKDVKGANSILVENKDSYMLNKCKDKNKFFIVDLCDDILVDTVVLGNFEFFSSQFRQFRVSVSDKYPVKASGWRELGVFEARNAREIQAFLVPDPQIWARYIRIEILSHYGSEYYCPISLFRVHGTTMMEEFKAQMDTSQRPGIEDDADDGVAEDSVGEDIPAPVAVEEVREEVREESNPTSNATEIQTVAENGLIAVEASAPVETVASKTVEECISPSRNPAFFEKIFAASTCDVHQPTNPASSMVYAEFYTSIPSIPTAALPKTPPGTPTTSTSSPVESVTAKHSPPVAKPSKPAKPVKQPRTERPSEVAQRAAANASQDHAHKNIQQNTPPPPPQHHYQQQQQHHHHQQQHYPPPTTQENFFKTIHKRLAYLEGNATLSLQYIEEQSRMLKEAFSKVEKKQGARTQEFLQNLNSTVWKELAGFKSQYDQLWQSTVIALQDQKSRSEQDTLDLNEQISLLAEEVVYQRRMGYVQSSLLLVCILLIIFKQNYTLENPLVQSLRQRGTLRFLESPPTSPLGNRGTPNRGHYRSPSEESLSSPIIDFTPPTPESNRSTPQPEVQVVRSSPATPRGERDAEEYETNWRGFQVKKPKKGKRERKGSPLKRGGSSASSSGGSGNGGHRRTVSVDSPGSPGSERDDFQLSGGSASPVWEYTP